MLKLMKYLKGSVKSIFLIILLLVLQAFCDLSLPSYTSNIVNIGIQQGGVDSHVPEVILVNVIEDRMKLVHHSVSHTILSQKTMDVLLFEIVIQWLRSVLKLKN